MLKINETRSSIASHKKFSYFELVMILIVTNGVVSRRFSRIEELNYFIILGLFNTFRTILFPALVDGIWCLGTKPRVPGTYLRGNISGPDPPLKFYTKYKY